MLADDDAVHAVIDGLPDGAPRGLVHVNMATISVPLARELAKQHQARGLTYVAATVFGRPDLAATGRLNIVAAGEPNAIARIQPLLDVIGQRTWRIGNDQERANVVKLAGNFMLGAAVEAMAEASAMAWRHGIAPADLLDVLTNGVFTAPSYKIYGEAIAKQRYEPAGFRLSLLLKDVRSAPWRPPTAPERRCRWPMSCTRRFSKRLDTATATAMSPHSPEWRCATRGRRNYRR